MSSVQYHALFGAGRLGLGLILPTLCSLKVPIVVFQRLGPSWEEIVNGCEWVEVFANSKPVTRLRCLLGKEEDTSDEELRKLLANKTSLLVNSHTPSRRVEKTILSHVTSCSAVVQPNDLPAIGECLAVCPDLQCRLFVVANDTSAVLNFAGKMKAITSGVDVVPVIADRICFSRKLEKGRVSVECEEFAGSMAFFLDQATAHDEDTAFPFTPTRINERKDQSVEIVVSKSSSDQRFREEMKTSLLNGLHFAMAVHGYHTLSAQGVDPDCWADGDLLVWQQNDQVEPDLQAFLDLHIHRLLSVYGESENKEAIMRAFTKLAFKRVRNTPDTLGRVLNLRDQARLRTKFGRYVTPLKHTCNQLHYHSDAKVSKLAEEGSAMLARLENKVMCCLEPQAAVPRSQQHGRTSAVDR